MFNENFENNETYKAYKNLIRTDWIKSEVYECNCYVDLIDLYLDYFETNSNQFLKINFNQLLNYIKG